MNFRAATLGLAVAILGCFVGVMPTPGATGRATATPRADLRLTGRTTKVQLQRGGARRLYLVTLSLELKNEGDKPAILFPGAKEENGWWLVSTQAARSTEALEKHDYVYFATLGQAYNATSAKWVRLRKALDVPRPPAGLTVTVEPGKSLTFSRDVALELFEYDIPAEDSTLWVQLSFQLWPRNIETGSTPVFGQRQQTRWAKYGSLQLDLISSEPIKIVLQ